MRNPTRNHASAMVSDGNRIWNPMFRPNCARASSSGSSNRRSFGDATILRPSVELPAMSAAAPKRGKLKIFFGAFPGAGKTNAMLTAARRMRDAGIDVVAAVVDAHESADLLLLQG